MWDAADTDTTPSSHIAKFWTYRLGTEKVILSHGCEVSLS